MQIQCASCGSAVAAPDVNLDRMLAKCARCNSVFDISGQLGRSDAATGNAALGRTRAPVPLPPSIRVVDDAVGAMGVESYRSAVGPRPRVVLERRWFTPAVFGMLFFCIAWDAFLVFWYSTALTGSHTPWIAIVFPVAHLAAGVALSYATLCGFVNSTRIAVEGGMLRVRHGPLPWRGNLELPTEDLDQLFCEEKIGNKGSRSYALSARLKTGRKVKLLSSLPDADQVLYIEQLLEDRLGILDVPVAGELSR